MRKSAFFTVCFLLFASGCTKSRFNALSIPVAAPSLKLNCPVSAVIADGVSFATITASLLPIPATSENVNYTIANPRSSSDVLSASQAAITGSVKMSSLTPTTTALIINGSISLPTGELTASCTVNFIASQAKVSFPVNLNGNVPSATVVGTPITFTALAQASDGSNWSNVALDWTGNWPKDGSVAQGLLASTSTLKNGQSAQSITFLQPGNYVITAQFSSSAKVSPLPPAVTMQIQVNAANKSYVTSNTQKIYVTGQNILTPTTATVSAWVFDPVTGKPSCGDTLIPSVTPSASPGLVLSSFDKSTCPVSYTFSSTQAGNFVIYFVDKTNSSYFSSSNNSTSIQVLDLCSAGCSASCPQLCSFQLGLSSTGTVVLNSFGAATLDVSLLSLSGLVLPSFSAVSSFEWINKPSWMTIAPSPISVHMNVNPTTESFLITSTNCDGSTGQVSLRMTLNSGQQLSANASVKNCAASPAPAPVLTLTPSTTTPAQPSSFTVTASLTSGNIPINLTSLPVTFIPSVTCLLGGTNCVSSVTYSQNGPIQTVNIPANSGIASIRISAQVTYQGALVSSSPVVINVQSSGPAPILTLSPAAQIVTAGQTTPPQVTATLTLANGSLVDLSTLAAVSFATSAQTTCTPGVVNCASGVSYSLPTLRNGLSDMKVTIPASSGIAALRVSASVIYQGQPIVSTSPAVITVVQPVASPVILAFLNSGSVLNTTPENPQTITAGGSFSGSISLKTENGVGIPNQSVNFSSTCSNLTPSTVTTLPSGEASFTFKMPSSQGYVSCSVAASFAGTSAYQPASVLAYFAAIPPAAFATRSPGCLVCHGTINGGFVTDFGYDYDGSSTYDPNTSNSLFLGGGPDVNKVISCPSPLLRGIDSNKDLDQVYAACGFSDSKSSGSIYGNSHFIHNLNGWSNSTSPVVIKGSLYIPAVVLPLNMPSVFSSYLPASLASSSQGVSLSDLVSSSLNNPLPSPPTIPPVTAPLTAVIDPSIDPKVKVVSLKKIIITSPSISVVQGLSSGLTSQDAIIYKNSSAVISGLASQKSVGYDMNNSATNMTSDKKGPSVLPNCNSGNPSFDVAVQGSNNIAYNSSPNINCTGDVVVLGTLYLNNVTINTDANGCRFYVQNSVFLNGKISVSGSSSSSNFQISSATAIMIGFSEKTASTRLLINSGMGDLTPVDQSATKNSVTYYRYRHNRTMREMTTFGLIRQSACKIWTEALSLSSPSSAWTAPVDNGATPMDPMSHVLFNAKEVHARYNENITGLIVGEFVIFNSGEFGIAYSSDPIFTSGTVPLLPLLSSSQWYSTSF